MRSALTAVLALLPAAAPLAAQTTDDPFPAPIRAGADVIEVAVRDFATLPWVEGEAPRPMKLLDEPGTGRLFVNGMRGAIWAVGYDGGAVREYVDIDEGRWGVEVQAQGRERGFQSFAFHPDFGREGSPGYGRFYTWTDTRDNRSTPDFRPGGGGNSHHTVLLEWRARDASAATYDGGPPRELARFEQPYSNHNGGDLAFDPLARPGDADYGMLYVGVADGGSGGDPQGMSQDLGSAFGKILRLDPLGSDGRTGEYGIPADNPFVGRPGALPEVWAYGVRNPQRFGWDPANGRMYTSDIGQNTVEEVSPVSAGANLGWNVWEGSFRYMGRDGVDRRNPRADRDATFPVAEYAHVDPLIAGRAAATGVVVYRDGPLTRLRGRVLFGDFPTGEIFHFDADDPPAGGNQGFGRVLLRDGGRARTFLQIIQAKNRAQGRSPASRTDLRFGTGPGGRVFLLNKQDATIREMVPG